MFNGETFKRKFLCPLGFHGRPIGGVDIVKYESNFDVGRCLRWRSFAKCARCHTELPDTKPVPEVTVTPDAPMDMTPPPTVKHKFYGRHDRWCEVCNKSDRDSIHNV